MKTRTSLSIFLLSLLPFAAIADGNTYVGASLSAQRITSSQATFQGWRPGLFIGYGANMPDCYYLGGEFLASWVTATENKANFRNQSLRLQPSLGLSFIPGMYFTESTMAIARFGIGTSKMQAANKWISDIVVGGGLESSLTPSWNVRLEYDYTIYGKTGNGGSLPTGQEIMVSFKYIYDA